MATVREPSGRGKQPSPFFEDCKHCHLGRVASRYKHVSARNIQWPIRAISEFETYGG